ncbi:MAG: CDP-diacylglycerol--glycerol-3-phosphate 3-phosphatidyltransferase [Candidatus Bipolaricaulota bacterium]
MSITRNLANKLTAVRIGIIPFIMYLALSELELLALSLFIVAIITDLLDGYVARSREQISAFGKFADPIVDKILITAVFVIFVQKGSLTAVPVVIILGREFLVTGLRLLALSEDKVIAASSLGKAKMISHSALIINIFLNEHWKLHWTEVLKPRLVELSVVLAIISAAHYFYKNRKVFKGGF